MGIFNRKKDRLVVEEMATPEQMLATELYNSCMAELLNNPDLTTPDAAHILGEIVDQASVGESGDEVTIDLDRFKEIFIGTCEGMGITTSMIKKEVSMKKGTKERMSMGLGRLLVAMDKVKAINIKSMGKRVGSVSSRVAMPLVSFTDGVREGWTSRKQS